MVSLAASGHLSLKYKTSARFARSGTFRKLFCMNFFGRVDSQRSLTLFCFSKLAFSSLYLHQPVKESTGKWFVSLMKLWFEGGLWGLQKSQGSVCWCCWSSRCYSLKVSFSWIKIERRKNNNISLTFPALWFITENLGNVFSCKPRNCILPISVWCDLSLRQVRR